MSSDLGTLRALSLPRFVAYMVVVGGLSGLLAWMLVLGGHMVLGIGKPSLPSLLWAIPRGALFAVVLGMVLRWHWRRRRGPDTTEGGS